MVENDKMVNISVDFFCSANATGDRVGAAICNPLVPDWKIKRVQRISDKMIENQICRMIQNFI